MKTKPRLKHNAKSLCDELTQDDGIDPRIYFSNTTKKTSDRKTRQLCKEIKQTIALTLAGEMNEPILANLEVIQVDPISGSRDFMVILAWNGHKDYFEPKEIALTLQKVSGFLRSEIAHSINRKRVPELSFRLLAPGEVRQ